MKKRKLRKIIREEAKKVLKEDGFKHSTRELGRVQLEDGQIIFNQHKHGNMAEYVELLIEPDRGRTFSMEMAVDDVYFLRKLLKDVESKLNI